MHACLRSKLHCDTTYMYSTMLCWKIVFRNFLGPLLNKSNLSYDCALHVRCSIGGVGVGVGGCRGEGGVHVGGRGVHVGCVKGELSCEGMAEVAPSCGVMSFLDASW